MRAVSSSGLAVNPRVLPTSRTRVGMMQGWTDRLILEEVDAEHQLILSAVA